MTFTLISDIHPNFELSSNLMRVSYSYSKMVIESILCYSGCVVSHSIFIGSKEIKRIKLELNEYSKTRTWLGQEWFLKLCKFLFLCLPIRLMWWEEH